MQKSSGMAPGVILIKSIVKCIRTCFRLLMQSVWMIT